MKKKKPRLVVRRQPKKLNSSVWRNLQEKDRVHHQAVRLRQAAQVHQADVQAHQAVQVRQADVQVHQAVQVRQADVQAHQAVQVRQAEADAQVHQAVQVQADVRAVHLYQAVDQVLRLHPMQRSLLVIHMYGAAQVLQMVQTVPDLRWLFMHSLDIACHIHRVHRQVVVEA